MKKWYSITVAVLAFMLTINYCYATTFTPANPTDTDSGYLIDNYSVLIDGNDVNSNYNFNTGTLAGFNYPGSASAIDSLGSITPWDGSNYFALVHTGPGSNYDPTSEHGNLMQPFTVTPNANVLVKMEVRILTNEDISTASYDDWFHHLVYSSSNGNLSFPGHDLFFSNVDDFSFNAAPVDTGFSWISDLIVFEFDITGYVNDVIQTTGSTEFDLHTVIGEHNSIAPTPEPATVLLFSIGLLAITGLNRKKIII